tara:strand:- start:2053 stop:2184 length:132 start_codon:yes stop_codon:yes gene_type:complete
LVQQCPKRTETKSALKEKYSQEDQGDQKEKGNAAAGGELEAVE